MASIRDSFDKAMAERRKFRLELRQAISTESFMNDMVKNYQKTYRKSHDNDDSLRQARDEWIAGHDQSLIRKRELKSERHEHSVFRTMTNAFAYFMDDVKAEIQARREQRASDREARRQQAQEAREARRSSHRQKPDAFSEAMDRGDPVRLSDCEEKLNNFANAVTGAAEECTHFEKQAAEDIARGMSDRFARIQDSIQATQSLIDRYNAFASENGLQPLAFAYSFDGPANVSAPKAAATPAPAPAPKAAATRLNFSNRAQVTNGVGGEEAINALNDTSRAEPDVAVSAASNDAVTPTTNVNSDSLDESMPSRDAYSRQPVEVMPTGEEDALAEELFGADSGDDYIDDTDYGNV